MMVLLVSEDGHELCVQNIPDFLVSIFDRLAKFVT
jgi:hypothetical protein